MQPRKGTKTIQIKPILSQNPIAILVQTFDARVEPTILDCSGEGVLNHGGKIWWASYLKDTNTHAEHKSRNLSLRGIYTDLHDLKLSGTVHLLLSPKRDHFGQEALMAAKARSERLLSEFME